MSSAFRPKGVSASRARTTREIPDYPRDRLAIVDGFDLSRGVMLATEKDTNQKLEVSVLERKNSQSAASAASAVRSAAEKKWSGNKIDALMSESLTAGTWVILEGCRGSERITKGKESIQPVVARWIINVSEPRPDKCFNGVFTLRHYKGAVDNIQSWDDKAIDANDGEALKAFSQELDEVHAKFKNRERPVRRGFQFRLVEELEPATEGVGGKPGRPPVQQVVNMSYPIDWLAGEEGNAEDVGSPPTGALFSEYVNGYVDHVWGKEDGSTQPAFPPERLEKMRFEITTYNFYKAGDPKFNDRMLVSEPEPGSFPNRLYQLGTTPTRYSFDDDLVQGKNLAVRGILQLINDGFDKKSNPPQIIANYLVRQLFTNGPVGHVQSMIQSSDGHRVTVHPDLDWKREPRPDSRNSAAPSNTSGSTELNAAGGDALSGVEDPFASTDDAGSFLSDAPPAPAPEPAAPAAEAAPAEAAGEGARFQRRRPGAGTV